VIASSEFALITSCNFSWSKQLIAGGLKITQLDSQGCNALHIASRRSNLELIIVLLQNGFDINAKGQNGWYNSFSNIRTALHEAVSVSDLQTVHYLLYKNAQVNIKNANDETPKDLAIRKGLDSSTIDLFFSM
jgi:ankyrin repeat protein